MTKKQIIYSDKSESSIDEEIMGDTPSNYNILNGRFDGKSAGLKSILQHANTKKPDGQAAKVEDPLNQVIRATRPSGAKEEGKTSPRAPVAPRGGNIKGISRTNEKEERKFVSNLRTGKVNGASAIDRDSAGGWGSIN